MAKCLVLGADGFLGSHLVEALAASGHQVRAVDRFKDGQAQKLPEGLSSVEVMPGNFLNQADLDQAVDGMDYVFHFISTTNPASSAKNPVYDVETNMRMSVELMELCVKHKVRRLIFPSTGGSIYGRHQAEPFKETDATEPLSPYSIGKLAIEGYLRFYKHAHGLDYLALRLSNPFGERQNVVGSQGVIPIFLNLIRQDLPLSVYGPLTSTRDYIYIKDIIGMIVQMFDQPTQHPLYNLGSGQAETLGDLIKSLGRVTGQKVETDPKPARATDLHSVVLDVSRFKSEFKLPVETSLEEGIRRTWQYVQALEEDQS